MEGVSLRVFIHNTHEKAAGFTFALEDDRRENPGNR
ncbi:hypothetical protein ALQ48_04137 [Pseudomonas coronafaciens pv. zizaniae]|nr:hypothetical protein ALQ48_04137 [Pseudomonas coronafaciens pv. zizaniae]